MRAWRYFDDDGRAMNRPHVYATTDRRVPLETYPHYSDERFSNGRARTVFGRVPDGAEYIRGLEYVYDDRMRQWDYAKHERAWKEAETLALPNRSADLYEAYLSAYFGEPVSLLHVLAGVNVSNGYPYVVFGYRRKESSPSAENPKADLR